MTIAQTHVKAKFSFGEDQDDVASWIIPTKPKLYLLAAQPASVIHLPGPVSSASRRPRHPTYHAIL